MDNINDIERSISNSFGAGTIKDKIVSGIKYATEKLGVKLVADQWGTTKNDKFSCACVLGCMILANDRNLSEDDSDHNEREAAKLLGVDDYWVIGFITGFDGGTSGNGSYEAYKIGQEIRNEFNLDSSEENEEDEDDDSDDGEDHF